MVNEIECPHCHSKVMPKHRFSSTTFKALLVLGIIPFILTLIGYAILWNALSPFLGLLTTVPTTPGMPSGMIGALTVLPTSFEIISIGTVVLNLVMGIIPAIVYWVFRHGTYNCPICEIAI